MGKWEKYLLTEKGDGRGMWSGNVQTKYHPPEKLFTLSAEEIATQLAKDSVDLKQAMSRLNFYMNRAGGNLSQERIKTLNMAKELIRAKFSKGETK